jgi:hypothetical protein
LYRVPGAAAATLVSLRPNGSLPGEDVEGSPVTVAHPSPSTWKMTTNAATGSALRLRLSNVPGWHATIDGKPVDLQSFGPVMLQVRVPAGRHQIDLRYWPNTFSIGLILALCGVLGLAIVLILARLRPRSFADSEKRSFDAISGHPS